MHYFQVSLVSCICFLFIVVNCKLVYDLKMAETCRHLLTNKIWSYNSCVLTDPPTLKWPSVWSTVRCEYGQCTNNYNVISDGEIPRANSGIIWDFTHLYTHHFIPVHFIQRCLSCDSTQIWPAAIYSMSRLRQLTLHNSLHYEFYLHKDLKPHTHLEQGSFERNQWG